MPMLRCHPAAYGAVAAWIITDELANPSAEALIVIGPDVALALTIAMARPW